METKGNKALTPEAFGVEGDLEPLLLTFEGERTTKKTKKTGSATSLPLLLLFLLLFFSFFRPSACPCCAFLFFK
jgi:hypothetical protein